MYIPNKKITLTIIIFLFLSSISTFFWYHQYSNKKSTYYKTKYNELYYSYHIIQDSNYFNAKII